MPGWFRTNFAKPDSIVYNAHRIEDYDYLRQSYQNMSNIDGFQPGNPDKVADVFIELIENENPPVNFFLGSDAFKRATEKLELLSIQMNNFERLSCATDF